MPALSSNRGSKSGENGKASYCSEGFSEMLPNLKLGAGRPGSILRTEIKPHIYHFSATSWYEGEKNLFTYPLHSWGFFIRLSKVSLTITEMEFLIFRANEKMLNKRWRQWCFKENQVQQSCYKMQDTQTQKESF